MPKTNDKQTKIIDVQVWQGGLYQVMGEDEMLYVFDAGVVVVTADNRRWIHKTFLVKGAGRDEDGCTRPNRGWREEVETFRARVDKRGTVDLAYWEELIEESWQERERYNLRCEEDERAWGGL